VGGADRPAPEHLHHESAAAAPGLDPKKKSLGASERDEAARAAFRQEQEELTASALVVVDEMGSNIALTPLYARAPRGERAYDHVPRNHGKNTTLIGALSLSGIDCAMTLEGAVDTPAFVAFIREVLCPRLRPGQTVLMDNLSSHKDETIAQLIAGCGCQLRFLPSYSPDFSPIEQAFAKIKAYLRQVGARTKEALEAALTQAIDLITSQDARGFFHHCGYPIPAQPS
jgi:transposase